MLNNVRSKLDKKNPHTIWKVESTVKILPQCPNLIDLGGPQWRRLSVKGNGIFLQFQTKLTPL